MMNKPWPSFLDGLGNGLGYALILVIVGNSKRNIGKRFPLRFHDYSSKCFDGGYMNNGMMTMPAMALILLGCVIWIHRAYFYKEEKNNNT